MYRHLEWRAGLPLYRWYCISDIHTSTHASDAVDGSAPQWAGHVKAVGGPRNRRLSRQARIWTSTASISACVARRNGDDNGGTRCSGPCRTMLFADSPGGTALGLQKQINGAVAWVAPPTGRQAVGDKSSASMAPSSIDKGDCRSVSPFFCCDMGGWKVVRFSNQIEGICWKFPVNFVTKSAPLPKTNGMPKKGKVAKKEHAGSGSDL